MSFASEPRLLTSLSLADITLTNSVVPADELEALVETSFMSWYSKLSYYLQTYAEKYSAAGGGRGIQPF